MTDDLFDHTADVVVVGAGAAGYGAALTAAQSGASVLMVERGADPGGTTILSGGTAWIPNNSLMRQHGLSDPKDDCLRFLCRLAFPHLYDPDEANLGLPEDLFALIEAFYDNGSVAIDFLVSLGAMEVEFDGETPDYHTPMEEDKAPYGRRMPQSGGSIPMFERLESVRASLGIPLLLEHRAEDVIRNEQGEICGLEARTGVRTVLIRANQAVVFATGGYLHNAEYVRNYLPARIFGGCASPNAMGDFLRIGQNLGAQLGNMDRAWWKQIVVEQGIRGPGVLGLPVAAGDSMVQVNRHGVRVVNEKAPYNERGQVHFQWDPTERDYPNLVLFHIWDQACAEVEDLGWRMPIPWPGQDEDYVIEGRDLAHLAEQIQERLDALRPHTGPITLDPHFVDHLETTIDRFNGFAAEGVDLDFRRGERNIEVKWNGAGRGGVPNPTMAPIAAEGPYFAAIVGAGAFDTNGGPRINANAQVLDVAGKPIPGLYGAGNCVASIAGQAYWGPGGTIGPALTYGYIAGLHAVKETKKALTN
jgi:3-oxosteroid 1-dehydrogenase